MMYSLLPGFVANFPFSDSVIANVVNAPGELLGLATAIDLDGVDVVVTLTG